MASTELAQQGIGSPIGTVENATGEVIVIRADGTREQLELGDPIYQGDTLETADDGSIGVVLVDETTFSMGENGTMVLDELVYDASSQSGSINLSVVEGVFTFVSGQIAKTDPDAMTLDTPVATIGIRGTQVGINYREGEEMDIALMQESDGFVGEVVVTNQGGVTILNQADTMTSIMNGLTAPTAALLLDQSAIISKFGSSLQSLPEVTTGNTYGVAPGAANSNEPSEDEALSEEDLSELTNFETAAGGNEEPTDVAGAPPVPGQPVEDVFQLDDVIGEIEEIIEEAQNPEQNAEEQELQAEEENAPPPIIEEPIEEVEENTEEEAEEEIVEAAGAPPEEVEEEAEVDTLEIATTGTVSFPGENATAIEGETYLAHMVAQGSSDYDIEEFLGLESGAMDALNSAESGASSRYSNATEGAAVKGTMNLNEGDTVSFKWFFDAEDYVPYDDFAAFSVSYENGESALMELADVSDVGNYGDSGWQTFEYTATTTGEVTLGFSVMNVGDTSLDPNFYIADVSVNGEDVGYSVTSSSEGGSTQPPINENDFS